MKEFLKSDQWIHNTPATNSQFYLLDEKGGIAAVNEWTD